MQALVPTFQPPQPSMLKSKSPFEKMEMLVNLLPKKSFASNRPLKYTEISREIPNHSISEHTNETLELFGGAISVKDKDKPTNNNTTRSAIVNGNTSSLSQMIKPSTMSTNPKKLSDKGLKRSAVGEVINPSTNTYGLATNDNSIKELTLPVFQSNNSQNQPRDSSIEQVMSSDMFGFQSCDFNGIDRFCKNAGATNEGLNTLLSEIVKLSQDNKCVAISCIWNDLSSNHSYTSRKYCTPSIACDTWYCCCDRQIHVKQGYKPLLGITIAFSNDDFIYFLPLCKCSNDSEYILYIDTYNICNTYYILYIDT